MLIAMAAAMPLSHELWMSLLNNFVYEEAGFTGRELGILQSIREVPGFLAFGVVVLLLVFREQPLALLSLGLLGIGVAMTGFFPTAIGLYCTTFVMSIGFHYYATLQNSLTLQWIEKERAPLVFARQVSVRAIASLLVFAFIWLAFEQAMLPWWLVYCIGGIATFSIALGLSIFPALKGKAVQHKHIVLRPRYWLYYALVFMSGARRQIFLVFAGFLMVEKFGFSVSDLAIIYAVNFSISAWLAPRVGRLIQKWGERNALLFEYAGLVIVFTAYAFVSTPELAAILYIVDHLFFAFAIAIETYFQKIADQRDIASTAGVSFTINHIAAVVIPVSFGLIWLFSNALVFLLGAAMACISLILALMIPHQPCPGQETVLRLRKLA
ncbi:MAG: MFS transporter [Pseudomonadota bacterium]